MLLYCAVGTPSKETFMSTSGFDKSSKGLLNNITDPSEENMYMDTKTLCESLIVLEQYLQPPQTHQKFKIKKKHLQFS